MIKLKPIEQLTEDVEKGDLVRFKIARDNEYVGYFNGTKRHPHLPSKNPYLFTSLLKTGYWDIGRWREDVVDVKRKKLVWFRGSLQWTVYTGKRIIEGYEILRRYQDSLKDMGIKPIELFKKNVKEGDLIRLRLKKDNEYTGYFIGVGKTLHEPFNGSNYGFRQILKFSNPILYDLANRVDIMGVDKKCFEWNNGGSFKDFQIRGYEIIRRNRK